MKTSDELWQEKMDDIGHPFGSEKVICSRCTHSTRDLTCKLSGEFERDVCTGERQCHRKCLKPPKSPEQLARERAELDAASNLPESEWVRWVREHEDYSYF